MTVSAPLLKVSPPTGSLLSGRGFYQLEDDSLYVPVDGYADPARFFSFLESDQVRFDLDLKGRLMMIEISLPRRQRTVEENISYPLRAVPADIRWLDFRQPLQPPAILTDSARLNVMLRFSDCEPAVSHFLADKIICQIDADHRLIALWITDIVDDIAGQEIKAFRKAVRARNTA